MENIGKYKLSCPWCFSVFSSSNNSLGTRNIENVANCSLRDHCVDCHPRQSIDNINTIYRDGTSIIQNSPFAKYDNYLQTLYVNISRKQTKKLNEWGAKNNNIAIAEIVQPPRKRKREQEIAEQEIAEQEIGARDEEIAAQTFTKREQELAMREQALVIQKQTFILQEQEYLHNINKLTEQNNKLTEQNNKLTEQIKILQNKLFDISEIISPYP
jgi:hypothetical protein